MLQLNKFPDIPISSREEERESRPHPEEPSFRRIAREVGSFPCVVGKEFPAFPSHLKRRLSQQETREELQGRATFPESPRCLSPFQGNLFSLNCLDFQAEDRLTPRWHVGQPCGKASWESLEGKPRRKSTNAVIHAKGSATVLLQLGRKAHVHAPLEARTDSPGETPKVPQDPCQHWRGILRFRHRLHTRSYAPASRREESREAPEQFTWGLAFREATRVGP